MPLRDHFHPPIADWASTDGMYGGWPAVIVQHLHRMLPPGYAAAPRVRHGFVTTRESAHHADEPPPDANGAVDRGGLGTPGWAPPDPSFAVETALGDSDEYEVRVYDVTQGRRLVAAVEIVSPSNKDRPENRRQFVAKCAALLRQDVSVILVDLVTTRGFNLYAELLDWVGERDAALGVDPPGVYAVACRWHPRGASRWLEAWNRPMAVGRPLPVLPLWLTDELAIPLDLEASYEQACRDLRIIPRA